MSLSSSRALVLSLCAALLAVVAPQQSDAQVLPLISERDADAVTFWWSNPDAPALSALERALLETDAGLFIDPAAVEPAPRVSRVHRVPDPPSSSVLNLGRLYGAAYVLAGALDIGRVEPTAHDLGRVATANLSYRLVAVDAQVTRLEISRRFVGVGATETEALDDIRRQVVEHVSLRLRVALSGVTALGEDAPTEPTLLIDGLVSAAPLVALMGELRSRSAIVADLQETWATEGRLAVRVALQPGQTTASLDALLAELGGVADWDYLLVVERRDGLATTVRIEPAVDESVPTE